jgi:predicted TIM-barrel fold metal-dependent hydrolase
VPAFCDALGIPGIVDIHTHFMPDRVLQKVWAWFDGVRTPGGEPFWPITYRGDEQSRLAALRAARVCTFTSLNYAHKAGMAQSLNEWSAQFAAEHADCALSATFYPEPGVDAYVAAALERGVRVFKVHLEVGAFDPRDPILAPVWRRIADSRVPVVCHAGSGPVPGPYTGPGPISEVLAANPDLVAVIAHMGGPEYEEFWDLALRYPNVHLDTTMTFTDFMGALQEYPPHLLEVMAHHPDRVVFGSDFPNIPHPFAHQVQALVRLELGEEWLRAVCYDNGARLLRVAASTLP